MSFDVPIQRYEDGLMVVDVRLGGRLLPFLFDTGLGVTAVVPQVAAALSREPYGRLVLLDKQLQRVDARLLDDVELIVEGHRVRPDPTCVIDLMARLPSSWPPLGGSIGLQAFDGHAVTLDLGWRRLVVEDDESLERTTERMVSGGHRLARESMGSTLSLFLAANTASGTLWLEIDSACTLDAVLAPHAAAMVGVPVPSGGRQPAEGVVELELELQGLGAVDVTAAIWSGLRVDGVLGLPFLARHLVTVDLCDQRVWLAKRR